MFYCLREDPDEETGLVSKTFQRVEKVVVGPVGRPKQDQSTTKYILKHYKTGVFSPLTGIGEGHEGVFQHAGLSFAMDATLKK
jgi:hypothetical protein